MPLSSAFAHIVNGKRRDRCRDQGFHFNARDGCGASEATNGDSVLLHFQLNINFAQRNWMTHWDELRGALGGHDAGYAGDFQRIAFGILRQQPA